MPLEKINWLLDVREYRRVAKNRKGLREPGQGTDYTDEKFRGAVKRVVSRIHPRRMTLRVAEILRQTATAKTFCFERVDGPLPPFRAGQYLNVLVTIEGIRTSRPYSISSAPGAGRLELTVRDKPGGFLAPYLLNSLKVGESLESSGPAGHFYYEPLIDGADLVFLAGGSGITPFMSMIRDTVKRQRPLKINLLYGNRTPEDVIFRDELEKLAAAHSNFTFSLVISEPPEGYAGLKGFLDSRLIAQVVGDIEGKTFYVCGPRAMHDLCGPALKELGVPQRKARYELYGTPEDVGKEPGWPEGLSADVIFEVDVAGKKLILAKAGEPLLNTLDRAGLVVPALCRSGGCSACRIRLLEGKVFVPSQAAVRESDRKAGYIHSCVSYPITNLKVRL
ncbi:MAG: FAD-binding oxidoreductase [Deltaproteobacteria bacterium]